MPKNIAHDPPLPPIPVRPACRDCRCVVLDTESELLSCGREWESLRAACGREDPFGEWKYLCDWWKTFGKQNPETGRSNRLFVLKVYAANNELVAIFPFITSPFGRLPGGLNVMRLFGHNGNLGPGDMSEMPLHLVRPGWEAEATQAVAEAARSRMEKRLCEAVLIRLNYEASDTLFQQHVADLSKAATAVVKLRTGSMVAPLPSSWKSYLKGLSKSMRDNTKYYPKLLERAGHTWDVVTVSDPGKISTALDTVIDLHRLRAKSSVGRRHENHLSTPTQARFLRDLMLRKAQEGQAFVSILHIDGRPAAAQAFFSYGDKIAVYYSGFDPVWFKFSPITVLQSRVFQDAIERGVPMVEFFLEDAPWKARWGALPQGGGVEVFLCSRAPLATAKAAIWASIRALWRALESLEKNRRAVLGKIRVAMAGGPVKPPTNR